MSEVSTHSRLKAAGPLVPKPWIPASVSTHSRLKAAGDSSIFTLQDWVVSTHSRLKAAGGGVLPFGQYDAVSTHSRLKAAGSKLSSPVCRPPRFNTQPPEGGWELSVEFEEVLACFNTQPPEGGWSKQPIQTCRLTVSTHSRLKAAGYGHPRHQAQHFGFQHTAA